MYALLLLDHCNCRCVPYSYPVYHIITSRRYDLFDLVVVGATKPSFLTDSFLPLYRLEKNGRLFNIEDKDSLSKLVANDSGSGSSDGTSDEDPVHLFQGGHWRDLQNLLDIASGENVLYVGELHCLITFVTFRPLLLFLLTLTPAQVITCILTSCALNVHLDGAHVW